MAKQWIAILGSIDATRPELGLNDLGRAPQVLQEIGRALAEKGCGIEVYSSKPTFIEPHVVKGYVDSGKATEGSIRVTYSRHKPKPDFPEEKDHPGYFEFNIDQNERWEVSFYRSLCDVDGAFLLGGGESTFIAGIVATTWRKPIVALAGFGGTAARVWDLLNPSECESLKKEEKSAMAVVSADPNWARRMVEILLVQKTRLAKARRRWGAQALAVPLALLLALALFVFTWDGKLSRWLLLSSLVVAPALAGMAASMVRDLWDQVAGETGRPNRSVLNTALFGGTAGLIAGLLYVVAQLAALAPTDPGPMPPHVSRLVPFALLTGFLAGFAADAFFRKLRDRDVGLSEVPALKELGKSS